MGQNLCFMLNFVLALAVEGNIVSKTGDLRIHHNVRSLGLLVPEATKISRAGEANKRLVSARECYRHYHSL